MAHPSAVRLIPDCRVSLDGKKLNVEMDARLTKVEVDLDVDLFGQCILVFNDPAQKLINGTDFKSGTPVKVEIGFASTVQKVFEGEVVALEPQFRCDMPTSLRVVCQESLHRLALSQMTRAFHDVDDKQIVGKIANEHGLSGDAPAGSKQHVLQGNVTDAVFLRRLAQKHGNHLRIEGKKLIIGPPPKGAQLTIGPGDGTRKVKVRIQTKDQVEEIAVHGYDPKTKQEFVGKAKGQGVTGEGTQKYGKGKTLSFAGQEHQPRDQATAEAMAKGRMRKLAEGHVVANVESIGDPGMLPGATVKLEKLGAEIDGSYRVERALHHFSKHGYYVNFKAVRVAKAKPPAQAKPVTPPPKPAPTPTPTPTPTQQAGAGPKATPSARGKFGAAHFETDKAFPLPEALSLFRGIAAFANQEPQRAYLVLGHTDSVGHAAHNQKLSEERAEAIAAYLKDEVDGWVRFYAGSGHQSAQWGARESTAMATTLGFASVKEFQDENGVQDTAGTRRELIKQYMAIEGTSVPAGTDLKAMGVGDEHKLEKTMGDSPTNRRVDVFAFEKQPIAPAPGDCKSASHPGCKVYDAWQKEVTGPIEPKGAPPPKPPPNTAASIALSWKPAEGFCGDRVTLRADTQGIPDGTEVEVTLTPKQGNSPKLGSIKGTVHGNLFEKKFRIANVDFGTGGSAVTQVEVEAGSSAAGTVTTALLTVKGRSDGSAQHFSQQRSWSGFSAHARFDQSVAKFRNLVTVTAEVMQAWGATYLNMTRAGIKGSAGGCPFGSGSRWGRATSPNAMEPDQYYDGKVWLPLPDKFTPNAAEYQSIAFYQSGKTFISPSGGTWPEAFADYEFNDPAYLDIRKGWVTHTHEYWTEKFALRRKGCISDPSVNCCRYQVQVDITFKEISTHASDTILVGPGDFRSNASTFFMGDDRPGLVPHESGHLMDNPDEYVGGAVDPKLNDDGATKGIDPDCIMGQNLSDVKKRHYHAFAVMLNKLINTAYGNNDTYNTVAR